MNGLIRAALAIVVLATLVFGLRVAARGTGHTRTQGMLLLLLAGNVLLLGISLSILTAVPR
jgi:hypothetical protein